MVYRCPLCRKEMNNDFSAYVGHVEREIVKMIQEDHPEWAEGNGSCPKCYEYYKKQLKG